MSKTNKFKKCFIFAAFFLCLILSHTTCAAYSMSYPAIIIGLTVGLIGWGCFQLFTQEIINIFGQENDLYNEFALKCFHIFLGVVFLVGFLIPSGIFFQSIGKPTKAMVCTLTRQLLYFLPCAYILSGIMGIDGLLYAGPVGDILAAITVAVLIIGEMRIINRDIKAQST